MMEKKYSPKKRLNRVLIRALLCPFLFLADSMFRAQREIPFPLIFDRIDKEVSFW